MFWADYRKTNDVERSITFFIMNATTVTIVSIFS